MGIKKFTDFKGTDKSTKENTKHDEPNKGKAPKKYIGASNPYDDEINKEILAQEVTDKITPDKQTNLKGTKSIEQIKDKSIKPHQDSIYDTKDKSSKSRGITFLDDSDKKEDKKEDKKAAKNEEVKFSGKVAKFPKNIKASKAVNFLENIKIAKKDIFYILVEKQENELQMVKYNQKEGVNLVEFVNELKKFYINKYKNRKDIASIFEKIEVSGEDRFSVIRNIPNLMVDNKKIITKITEDLITLLYK